jgi:hypothetical protein
MSKAHPPAFSGPQVNIPESARGSLNATTPADQRVPDRLTELSDGPNTKEIYGGITTYLPAKYEQVQIVENKAGVPVEHKIIREDR